jgi:hypothetical protein
MNLKLTIEQAAQLQALLDAKDFAGAYGLMEGWTRNSGDPDMQLVHTWLLGAGDINRGEGPFAALALAFNQRQGLLRGRTISIADNQGASNLIAQKVTQHAIDYLEIPALRRFV